MKYSITKIPQMFHFRQHRQKIETLCRLNSFMQEQEIRSILVVTVSRFPLISMPYTHLRIFCHSSATQRLLIRKRLLQNRSLHWEKERKKEQVLERCLPLDWPLLSTPGFFGKPPEGWRGGARSSSSPNHTRTSLRLSWLSLSSRAPVSLSLCLSLFSPRSAFLPLGLSASLGPLRRSSPAPR